MPEPTLRLHEEKKVCECGAELGTCTMAEADDAHVLFLTVGNVHIYGKYQCSICKRWYRIGDQEKQVDKLLLKLEEITGGTAEQLNRHRADYGQIKHC